MTTKRMTDEEFDMMNLNAIYWLSVALALMSIKVLIVGVLYLNALATLEYSFSSGRFVFAVLSMAVSAIVLVIAAVLAIVFDDMKKIYKGTK